MERLSINQWAEEDRPREKLRNLGAEALSKAELLAILIGSGTPKKSAVELMQDVMHDCGDNLNTLGKKTIADLMSYNGIGEAKAITILAACELAKRRSREKAEERSLLAKPNDIYNYMHTFMQDLDVEEAWVLLMNQNMRLIKAQRVARGGIASTMVDVRLVIKEALLNNATQIVLCHNHPSGNPKPSQSDDRLTEQMRQACATMKINFIDHIIISDGSYYSYSDEGRIYKF